MDVHVEPATSVSGEVHLPGDKSVSHRVLLLALASTRPVRIDNLAPGRDVERALAVIEQLGARVERIADDAAVVVTGVGLRGIEPPADGAPIDCGNSGTLARLLAGLLAGQPAGRRFELVGDESLSSRPMDRIVAPLAQLGATVTTSAGGTLPMVVEGAGPLRGGVVELEVASAQVQGAVLLAALAAAERTTVVDVAVVRDHTERALRRAGASLHRNGLRLTLQPADELQLPDTTVPADPSAAAPLIAAATLLPGSMLRLPGVIESPGRRGFVDVLESMGARVGVGDRRDQDGEPVADLHVEHAVLGRAFIEVVDVARMIDELPVLALMAHFCKGETVIRGAAELRVKESDRIATLEIAMRRIGVSFQPLKDGFIVRGSSVRPDGGRMHTGGDHRIAMLGGLAGLVTRRGVTVEEADCVDVSFPGWFELLDAIATR